MTALAMGDTLRRTSAMPPWTWETQRRGMAFQALMDVARAAEQARGAAGEKPRKAYAREAHRMHVAEIDTRAELLVQELLDSLGSAPAKQRFRRSFAALETFAEAMAAAAVELQASLQDDCELAGVHPCLSLEVARDAAIRRGTAHIRQWLGSSEAVTPQ